MYGDAQKSPIANLHWSAGLISSIIRQTFEISIYSKPDPYNVLYFLLEILVRR